MDELRLGAVERAVRRMAPRAEHLSVIDTRRFAHADSGAVDLVEVSWSEDSKLHTASLVVKPARDDVERRVLSALAGTGVPVPHPIDVDAEVGLPLLVMERLPGVPVADAVATAGMRWELTTLAFSFARALARVHALDWTAVVPWLADTGAMPEDLVDEQVDAAWARWEDRIAALPLPRRPAFERALRWLDLRRPVEVSVCLCHGDYNLANVLVEDHEVTGIVDWGGARVTDASYDLAVFPLEVARLGLSTDDVRLFVQAALGAYLQDSPRSPANTDFYSVARLLDRALDALEPAGAAQGGNAERALEDLTRAIAGGGLTS